MPSAIVEAHQFKGVWPDPVKAAYADGQLGKPYHLRDVPFNSRENEYLLHQMKQPPPFDGRVSMYFKNGASFDVQQRNTGEQYLVLPRENKSVNHQQVEIGEWICLMRSGKFIKLSDADYKEMGGLSEEEQKAQNGAAKE